MDWPWVTVYFECGLCRKHGSVRLARLAERHGAEITLDALLRFLAARCALNKPGVKPRRYKAQCEVRYRVPPGGRLPDGAPAQEAAPGEHGPPRLRRLGPTGPLPTIGECRRLGVTAVRIACEGLIWVRDDERTDRVYCHHVAEMSLDTLGLPDDAVFAYIPHLPRLRFKRCRCRKVRVLPSWPDQHEARAREVSAGTTPRRMLIGILTPL